MYSFAKAYRLPLAVSINPSVFDVVIAIKSESGPINATDACSKVSAPALFWSFVRKLSAILDRRFVEASYGKDDIDCHRFAWDKEGRKTSKVACFHRIIGW